MKTENLFDGEVAVVTGAGRGIGEAIACALAGAGCRVAVTDVTLGPAQAVADKIVQQGGQAESFALDIRDADACKEVADVVAGQLGPISVLVNNAGVTSRGAIEDDNFIEALHATFDVNVVGTLNVVRAFLPQLTETKGNIVNLASLVSIVAGRATIPYGASKGAVAQFTRSLARDLGPRGIRVNAIAPGFTESPMTQDLMSNSSRISETSDRTFLKRVAVPEDMTGPTLFLASKLSCYVTGHILPVDGGYTVA